MGKRKSAGKPTSVSRGRKSARSEAAGGFTAEERAAMRERAQELKSAATRSREGRASEEDAVLAKIAAMAPSDRALAERLHAIVRANAPGLVPKLWYGMPAYAQGGKIVCFFQGAEKFKTRYATLGFGDKAALDDGNIWPTAFALTKLTPDVEATIATLMRRAVGA